MKKLLCALTALLMLLPLGTCTFVEEPEQDWLGLMLEAAVTGDRETGEAAALGWNEKQALSESGEPSLDFGQLFLLARFIEAEANSIWFRPEYRQCVGEVVMNRLASPEFPDSLQEVIREEESYTAANSPDFAALLPSRESAVIALRILRGNRLLPPQVVYQRRRPEGKVHAAYCDRVSGFTYFCESEHPELYTDGGPEPQASERTID